MKSLKIKKTKKIKVKTKLPLSNWIKPIKILLDNEWNEKMIGFVFDNKINGTVHITEVKSIETKGVR